MTTAPVPAREPRAADSELLDPPLYTMWSAFQHQPGVLPGRREPIASEATAFLDDVAAHDVVVRGVYRLSGIRADADWLVWWHAPTLPVLQDAYDQLRRTRWGAAARPQWSVVGAHRPAEFNADHQPAYLRGQAPGRYLTVYPFVRSLEWYLLDSGVRARLLAEHGAAARPFPDVLSSTVASFGLSDYEWILALEAAEPHRIIDLMRAFRATRARRHVRLETPFYAGERVTVPALIATLP
ncbi:hydrogen peroxide-dependent heme synthase [Xylanimonas ulmi]|uniref:Coproheme decarboxylase n=1 Tax=Xylanimonas ulmi TaxID=228973 RepID=A0A4Q7M0B9_9MICO|nr:hydrogen peroxide-dependent heme synthase [Xylanibacterium ulmi]RZS61195.1 chlorite dismutase [Xylanibacterium ulmi]